MLAPVGEPPGNAVDQGVQVGAGEAIAWAIIAARKLDGKALGRAHQAIARYSAAVDSPLPAAWHAAQEVVAAARGRLAALDGDALAWSATTIKRRRAVEGTGGVEACLAWTELEAHLAHVTGNRWVEREALAVAGALARRTRLEALADELAARYALAAAEAGRCARALSLVERLRGTSNRPRAAIVAAMIDLIDAGPAASADVVARTCSAVEMAASQGNLDFAIAAAVQLVRVADRDTNAVALLASLRRDAPFVVVDAHCRHAEVAAEGSSRDLLAVAMTYIRLGRRMLAAELVADAARRAPARRAEVLKVRARGMLASCPGAWSWRVADIDLAVMPLDDVDRMVGRAVVAGLDNQDVAVMLSLSPRSIERRLTGLFRCLGVKSRRELRQWHAPLFEPGLIRSRSPAQR